MDSRHFMGETILASRYMPQRKQDERSAKDTFYAQLGKEITAAANATPHTPILKYWIPTRVVWDEERGEGVCGTTPGRQGIKQQRFAAGVPGPNKT
jgi:hypothetical protein